MSLIYNTFYKTHGVRAVSHLVAPRIFPMAQFQFPLNSLLHFVTYDENTLGPDSHLDLIQAEKNLIAMDNVIYFASFLGNPKKTTIQPINLNREFLKHQKEFRFIKNPWVNTKIGQLVILNYAYLNKLYNYTKQPLLEFYHWSNLHKTVVENASSIADNSSRHQFIHIPVPDVLPSMNTLNVFENKVTPNILKLLNEPNKFWFLELWKWLEDNPKIPSVFSSMTPKKLEKLNILFTHGGYWSLVNMGILQGYFMSRKGKDNSAPVSFHPKQMQKNFLRMMMAMQTRNVSTTILGMDEEIPEIPSETNQAPSPDLISSADIKDPDEIKNEITESENDEDLALLETIEKKNLMSQGLTTEGDVVKTAADSIDKPTTVEEMVALKDEIYTDYDDTDSLKRQISQYAEYGLMSAAEYKNMLKQTEEYAGGINPYNDGKQPIKDYIKIPENMVTIKPEDTVMTDSVLVFDKSMNASTINTFDRQYLKNVLKRDIVSMVSNVQRAGIVIQEHSVDEVTSIVGDYDIHTLRFKPIDGAPSIARFRIPKINDEGEFFANGVKCRMRKQRTDVPIRKIKPNVVTLSSYYGKVFIQRSEKRAYDSYYWIYNKIIGIAYSGMDSHITKVAPANVFDNAFKSPKIYSGLSRYLHSFTVGGDYFTFNHLEREKLKYRFRSTRREYRIPLDVLKELEGNNRVLVGVRKDEQGLVYPIVVDYSDKFYVVTENSEIPLGNIYDILQLPENKAPIDYIEAMILGKGIPLGFVLSYLIGISKVCKLLDAKPRVLEAKTRVQLKSDEWALVFKDKKLIFSRQNQLATLLLGGLYQYRNELKNYYYESFDNQNVYLNILLSSKLNARYLREIDLLNQLFVDPITRQILQEMNEPTTFKGLLVRAGELLLLDKHPDSQDMRFMRVKGYERMAGAVYKEMVKSIKEYKNRNIRGKSKIEMHPFSVWVNITRDPSVKLPEDINPLAYLREVESLTYGGEGGRDKGAMPKTSRAYHKSDIGVVSEATSDSSDVGFNTFLSANPNVVSVRGLVKTEYAPEKDGFTSMVSTPFLLSSAAASDSASRANMISIQQNHTVWCEGYHQPSVRTGYESVVAKRVGGMFAQQAMMKGKVISVTPKALMVEYEDGQKHGYELGRQYGKAEGSVYPHDIVTRLKPNDFVEKGQVLTYNTGFFEPDFMDPKSIVWKSSMDSKVAFYESTQTLEDSCSISDKISRKLKTKTTKVKSYIMKFNQGISNVIKPGSSVKPNDILLIFQDEVTNEAGIFDEESLKVLKKFSNFAPKSKFYGVLDKIEIYYHGSKDDMSPTLRKLVDYTDKQLIETCKALGKKSITGSVNDEYSVDGKPLILDTAEIKLYFTVEDVAGVGDKVVFGNQLKSVIGEVMHKDMVTESGQTIDAVFGYRSAAARTVNSPLIIGTTSTLLKVISQKAIDIYKS